NKTGVSISTTSTIFEVTIKKHKTNLDSAKIYLKVQKHSWTSEKNG
ncbi:6162_t:CDS:1, partial [Dentiscutata heterogama]